MIRLALYTIAFSFVAWGCAASSVQNGSDPERGPGRGNETAGRQEAGNALDRIYDLLKSGDFRYRVQSVNPVGGGIIQITSTYTLEADDGIYEAYLPYYGRAYSLEYGGNGGIEFQGTPEELQIEKDPANTTVIVSFEVDDGDDWFSGTLSVGPGGYGTLTITSRNRQSISYYGRVSE